MRRGRCSRRRARLLRLRLRLLMRPLWSLCRLRRRCVRCGVFGVVVLPHGGGGDGAVRKARQRARGRPRAPRRVRARRHARPAVCVRRRSSVCVCVVAGAFV
jgi:hypothetical protein